MDDEQRAASLPPQSSSSSIAPTTIMSTNDLEAILTSAAMARSPPPSQVAFAATVGELPPSPRNDAVGTGDAIPPPTAVPSFASPMTWQPLVINGERVDEAAAAITSSSGGTTPPSTVNTTVSIAPVFANAQLPRPLVVASSQSGDAMLTTTAAQTRPASPLPVSAAESTVVNIPSSLVDSAATPLPPRRLSPTTPLAPRKTMKAVNRVAPPASAAKTAHRSIGKRMTLLRKQITGNSVTGNYNGSDRSSGGSSGAAGGGDQKSRRWIERAARHALIEPPIISELKKLRRYWSGVSENERNESKETRHRAKVRAANLRRLVVEPAIEISDDRFKVAARKKSVALPSNTNGLISWLRNLYYTKVSILNRAVNIGRRSNITNDQFRDALAPDCRDFGHGVTVMPKRHADELIRCVLATISQIDEATPRKLGVTASARWSVQILCDTLFAKLIRETQLHQLSTNGNIRRLLPVHFMTAKLQTRVPLGGMRPVQISADPSWNMTFLQHCEPRRRDSPQVMKSRKDGKTSRKFMDPVVQGEMPYRLYSLAHLIRLECLMPLQNATETLVLLNAQVFEAIVRIFLYAIYTVIPSRLKESAKDSFHVTEKHLQMAAEQLYGIRLRNTVSVETDRRTKNVSKTVAKMFDAKTLDDAATARLLRLHGTIDTHLFERVFTEKKDDVTLRPDPTSTYAMTRLKRPIRKRKDDDDDRRASAAATTSKVARIANDHITSSSSKARPKRNANPPAKLKDYAIAR